MIVGDSNLVKLIDDINRDPLLQTFSVTTRCRPGMRAKFLDSEGVEFCSNFTHCIVFLGNNDVSEHPTKTWLRSEYPVTTAARICGFADHLRIKNVEVAVVGLVARPDVAYDVIKESNSFIQWYEGQRYVGPRKVHSNHFLKEHTRDNVHLNEDGKKRVLALFLRIITQRFKLGN